MIYIFIIVFISINNIFNILRKFFLSKMDYFIIDKIDKGKILKKTQKYIAILLLVIIIGVIISITLYVNFILIPKIPEKIGIKSYNKINWILTFSLIIFTIYLIIYSHIYENRIEKKYEVNLDYLDRLSNFAVFIPLFYFASLMGIKDLLYYNFVHYIYNIYEIISLLLTIIFLYFLLFNGLQIKCSSLIMKKFNNEKKQIYYEILFSNFILIFLLLIIYFINFCS